MRNTKLQKAFHSHNDMGLIYK
jgi:hypothetical protein